jgi:cysteine synthase A
MSVLSARAPGPPAITEAFARRARQPAVSSFAVVEQRAHAILPELARIRPTVGGTPLVAVPSRAGRGTVWLKLEAVNATGTIKARTAYALLCAAVARTGRPDVRLVEYSGGSLALALAEFCQVLDLDLHLVIPDGAPIRLRRRLVAQGAEVSTGIPKAGFLGAMEAAATVAELDHREFLLQHCASEVVAMHRETTGAELVGQLIRAGAAPVALAAAVGSGGSVAGVADAVRSSFADCRVLAVFPAEAPYGEAGPPTATRRMNGTGGLGYGLRQPLLRPYEDRMTFSLVAYPDALDAMRRLRAEHGHAVCGSGAGAWLAASAVVDDGKPGTEAVALVAARGTVEEWDHAAEH